VIEEQDRSTVLVGETLGAGKRLLERLTLVDERLLLPPGDIQDRVARALRPLWIAIGNRHHADAGLGNVGLLEAAERSGGEQAFGFGLARGIHEILHRPLAGVLAQRVREQGAVAPRHDRLHFFLQRAQQDAARQLTGFVLVHVGVGLVPGEHVAVAHHALGEVGVQIERDCNRGVRGNGAEPLQQGALAVVGAIGYHHCAVQVEKDRVAPFRHGVADDAADAIVGCTVDRTAGVGPRGDRREQLRAGGLGEVDERRHRQPCALHRVVSRLPEKRSVVAERLPRRGHRREGVGFVLHLRDDDAHLLSLTSQVGKHQFEPR
jgi:hypothetical protein